MSEPKKIRVMVVDDSAFMRKIIQQILSEDDQIEIVGAAKDGIEALQMAKERSPDVITLDVEMPGMDGISCLQKLLIQGKYNVIMVSSLTTSGAKATITALELGAIDFFPKPSNLFNISQEDQKEQLREKVHIAGNTKTTVLKPIVISKNIQIQKIPDGHSAGYKPDHYKKIIALGISTGGPRALQSVIPYLPADLAAPMIVVQHMPPGFTRSLANRLNEISLVKVKEAENGDELCSGFVYIAPGDYHIDLKKEGQKITIQLDKSPPMNGFRPSVDFLMKSVQKMGIKDCIGVIMTGMGSDGSRGLRDLKEKTGAYIIAQDEKTCSVFGMPRAAIELGIVDEIASLDHISASIVKKAGE